MPQDGPINLIQICAIPCVYDTFRIGGKKFNTLWFGSHTLRSSSHSQSGDICKIGCGCIPPMLPAACNSNQFYTPHSTMSTVQSCIAMNERPKTPAMESPRLVYIPSGMNKSKNSNGAQRKASQHNPSCRYWPGSYPNNVIPSYVKIESIVLDIG